MPSYRNITIGLVSQFDVLTIPEYAPPLHTNDPFSPSPTLINDENSIVSVYIPIYPSSQFWLSYSISPPHPPNAFYYFKFFHNSVCVVSWGCGEEDGYQGKTMFGLFESEQSWFGECGVEKRAFCFARDDGSTRRPAHNLGDVMEVRVYRSKGRRKTEPELTQFKHFAQSNNAGGNGQREDNEGRINFANAGLVAYQHPRRYYEYALLDPLDHPYATFRWYYRTWEELESIGVISPEPSTATASIHTTENGRTRTSKEDERHSSESNEALAFYNAVSTALSLNLGAEPDTDSHDPPADIATTAQPPTRHPSPPAIPPPQPAPPARIHPHTPLAERSPTPMPSRTHSSFKRAPTPFPEPIDHAHPSRYTEWLRRTPSPVKMGAENPSADAAAAGRPRGNSMGMLRGVVAAAVKRKVAWRSEGGI